MRAQRFAFALTAAAGGLLAAISFPSATAGADPTAPLYVIEPDGDATILSTGGTPLFDQSVVETGLFGFTGPEDGGGTLTFFAPATLNFYTNVFGFENENFVFPTSDIASLFTAGSVLDETNFGSGFENVYLDSVGAGAGGTNLISDTFYTPFGDFNVPTTFDAAAPFDPTAGAAEAIDPSGFMAALDADWTTLVTDFGALF